MIKLHTFQKLDSTMFEAERQIEAGETEAFAVCAVEQSGGHGRFGRGWASPPGNLYWTIALPRMAGWPRDHGVVLAAGLAVRDALLRIGLRRERVGLKWPNDALVDDRKISGILARSSDAASGRFVVVGIGVNVASHPTDAIYPATSLGAVGASGVTVDMVRSELTATFLHWFGLWERQGIPGLIDDYRSALSGLGTSVRVSLNLDRTAFVEGINKGVDDSGGLRVALPDGSIRVMHAGDVMPIHPANSSKSSGSHD